MPTKHFISTPDNISAAAEILRSGGLVAFPTETVYGLGGNATDDRAIAKIFEAKERPRFNPLIAHVFNIEEARRLVVWNDAAEVLATRFWPGPLTLVLPLRTDTALSPLVTAGLPSLALRVPDHPLAQALLAEVGVPIAAPSANPSGKISPTTAGHVETGLGGRIDAILDGGACDLGLESTIIGLAGPPSILRPGGLATEEIEMALGKTLNTHSEGINSPGQLESHYAPQAPLRMNALNNRAGEKLLGFGPDVETEFNLSPSGDLGEAAANLFAMLRQIDDGQTTIAVSPVPMTGLGRAINDRLKRAAAPRGA